MAPIIMKTPQYTTEERIFLLEQKMSKVGHKVLKYNYKKRFPFSGRSPSKMVVWKQQKKFKSKGSVLNQNKGNSGRKVSVLTSQNLNLMRNLFATEKNLPARQSRSSSRRHNLPVPILKIH